MCKIELASIFELESVNNKVVPQLFEAFSLLFVIKYKPLIEFAYFCSSFPKFLNRRAYFLKNGLLYNR